jgi:tetratricopeptide (TPR) repeat protein
MSEIEINLEKILATATPQTFKQELKKEIDLVVPKEQKTTTYQQIAQYLYIEEQFFYAIESWKLGIENIDNCIDKLEVYEIYKNYGLALNTYIGDYLSSIKYLNKANKILDEVDIDNIDIEKIEIVFGISRAYLNLDDLINAEIFAKDALEISIKLDNFEKIRAYLNLADVMLEKNQLDKAEYYYQKGLSLAKDKEQIVLKAVLFMNLGTLYKRLFNYKKALDYYKQSKEIYESIDFYYETAEVYINMATVLAKMIRYDDAIKLLESAKDYFVAIGHTHNSFTAYLNLGRVEQDRANYQKSIEYFDKAIEICRDNDNFINNYILLLYLKGNSFYDLKEIEKASKLYNQALSLVQNIDDKSLEASIKNSISAIHSYYKEFDKALEIYQKNIIIFEELGDIEELIATYTNLALLYDEIGYFQESYLTYQKALNLIKEYDLKYLEVSILINQAELFQNFLKYNEALEQYNTILDKLKYMDNDYYIAKVYHNMANIFEVTMRFQDAIKYANLAMELKKSLGENKFLSIYSILARAYDGLGDIENSEKFYKLAFECNDLEYNKYSLLVNHSLLLINHKKDYNKAIKELKEAEKYYKNQNAIEPIVAIYDNLGMAFHKKGDIKRAIQYYKLSLDIGENFLLKRISREDLHMSHRVNFEFTYQKLIQLFLQINDINEAYRYFEKFKSQTFRKILSFRHFTSDKIPLELLEKEKKLIETLQDNKVKNFGELGSKIDNIYKSLDLLYNEMEQYDKQYIMIKKNESSKFEDVKKYL